ncbi:hypothetical protein K490DRAFT_66893 [Saccharata proteae CBS 121410]|uniref:Mid2 domain-containing protein n=1 Tax=Saccharata proteae CBS 121410 TaxID=1314787 RepID=A0A9P4LXQ9_9PEZI|nr:hypothetical protein K490DRAFT_66893 [Saccharata proteae CBS 121410]
MPPKSRRGEEDDNDHDSGYWHSIHTSIASEIMSLATAIPATTTLTIDGSTVVVSNNPIFPIASAPSTTTTTDSAEETSETESSTTSLSGWRSQYPTSTVEVALTRPTYVALTPSDSQTALPWAQAGSSAAADSTGTTSSSADNGSSSPSGSAISNGSGNHGGLSTGMITAVVVIPLVVILVLGFAGFLIHRRRKAQHEVQQERALEEMKMRGRHDFGGAGGAGGVPGSQSPSPSYQSSPYQDSSSTPPPAHTSPTLAAPIIIAPMGSGNGAYFTGIDTSEALSVRSSEREPSGGFMLDGEHHEEPPPPYRPASVPALSRDSSMRQPGGPGNASSSHLMAGSPDTVIRSPFADPPEEDAMSDVSTPTGTYARRYDDDESSFVSEISYQDGPTRIHQTV